MVQPYNKANTSTGDYRGSKAVLKERVIEGLENQNLTNNQEDLQLTYDSPKNLVITNIGDYKVILPNATTLINGWTVFVINNDENKNLEVCLFSQNIDKDLFATVESSKMVQCLLLDNSTESGTWKLISTGEFGTSTIESRYVTNVFDEKIIDYKNLSSGTNIKIPLTTIASATALKSILVKLEIKFRGAEIFLAIGTEEEQDKFYSDIPLSQDMEEPGYIKDLFEEILSIDTDKDLYATFYTKATIDKAWENTNTNTNSDILNSFYANSLYTLFADNNEILTSSSTSNFIKHTIEDFEFEPEAVYFENGYFYVAANKSGYFTICKTNDFENWQYFQSSREINSKPLFLVKCKENYIVVLNGLIASSKNLENNSWVFTENLGISDVLETSCSDNLCVISCANFYFTTDDGVLLSQNVNNSIYYKHLDKYWIRYNKNNTESSIIEYSTNFNDWNNLETNTLNIDEIEFLNGIWYVFTTPAQYPDQQLTISKDFFQTINRVDIDFANNKAFTVCGLPSQTLIAGEDGTASYSTGSDFFDLYSGQVSITVEKVKEINPITLNNVNINTNVPTGTIFNYPFSDVPDGYFRLCGEIFYNANTAIPEFINKLETAKANGYTNLFITNEQYQTLSDEQKNNCGSFSWTDDNAKKDLRFPKISSFLRGVGDINSLASVTGTYTTDTMRPISGDVGGFNTWIAQGGSTSGAFYNKQQITGGDVRGGGGRDYSYQGAMDSSRLGTNFAGDETQPKHVKYPYIICVYQGTQASALVDLESISDILTKDQEYILEVRDAAQTFQSGKTNNVRQCVTIAPNTNYVRSLSGLTVTCDANVWGTCAQGFINGLPNDVIINNKFNLTLSLPANTSGSIYLQKDITTNEVTLGSTTNWTISKTKANTGIWYDLINEKLFIDGDTPFYAVKIANYTTSSTAITNLTPENFRKKSIYDTELDWDSKVTGGRDFTAPTLGFLMLGMQDFDANVWVHIYNEQGTEIMNLFGGYNNDAGYYFSTILSKGQRIYIQSDDLDYCSVVFVPFKNR